MDREGNAPQRPEMERIGGWIRYSYGREAAGIRPLAGGLSALAYEADCASGERLFLKVYDRRQPGFGRWAGGMDQYISLLWGMNRTAGLIGALPEPVRTTDGAFYCEDGPYRYLVYRFIEGDTPGEGLLDAGQLRQLAGLLAAVHAYPPPQGLLRESFQIPFDGALRAVLGRGPETLVSAGQREQILRLLSLGVRLGRELKAAGLPMVLCHGDIHRGNLMQRDSQLVLIDWEGVSIAPPEADLFFFQRYEPGFSRLYRQLTGYEPHEPAIAFFGIRRRLDDIHEFLAELGRGCPSPLLTEGQCRRYLSAELERLELPMRFSLL